METKKIALACSIGAMLFCAVALVVAPHYTWLALFAGIAGGYFSYEFREVCKGVPVALGSAAGEFADGISEIMQEVGTYLHKPHPFAFPPLICEGFVLAWVSVRCYHKFGLGREFFGILFPSAILFAVLATVLGCMLGIVALFGAIRERCSWWKDDDPERPFAQKGNRLRYVPLSYSNAFRWIFLGLFVDLPETMGIFCWRSVRYFFRLIHSNKRLLCATDGTLGGIVSYYWLATSSGFLIGRSFPSESSTSRLRDGRPVQ